MPDKPPVTLELIWEHDLVFGGKSGDARVTLDSAGAAGPSPMQALAFGLAGCMAMDLVHILKKGRHDFRGLRADLVGGRADAEPRRFTHIELRYTITGSVPGEVVQRGIDLSREKYCSVWHSMRQDIEFTVTFTVSSGD
ncbi:MAG: OsmC family protein [Acidobacteria bacterium]|nr:OsmC family protein [Acidobacteriota bacterium]